MKKKRLKRRRKRQKVNFICQDFLRINVLQGKLSRSSQRNYCEISSCRLVLEALHGRKLEELSSNKLSQILTDVELLVKELSEELVQDLGARDELEYEKELKNTFISLLLSIQVSFK